MNKLFLDNTLHLSEHRISRIHNSVLNNIYETNIKDLQEAGWQVEKGVLLKTDIHIGCRNINTFEQDIKELIEDNEVSQNAIKSIEQFTEICRNNEIANYEHKILYNSLQFKDKIKRFDLDKDEKQALAYSISIMENHNKFELYIIRHIVITILDIGEWDYE